jgi:hypothetical protein
MPQYSFDIQVCKLLKNGLEGIFEYEITTGCKFTAVDNSFLALILCSKRLLQKLIIVFAIFVITKYQRTSINCQKAPNVVM